MLWWEIYVCGALVAAVGASVVADLSSELDAASGARAAVIALAGALWPVVLCGLLQLICIAGVAEVVSAAERRFRPATAEVQYCAIGPDLWSRLGESNPRPIHYE